MYQGREMEGGGQFFRPSTVTSVTPWISTASANLHMGSVGDFRELKGLEAWKHVYRHLSRLLCHWSLIPYFPVNSYYMDSLPYSDIQSLSWPGLNLLPACVYNFFPIFLTYQPDYLTVYTPKMVLFKLQSLATISGSSIRLGALQGVVQSLRCVWLSVTPWIAACRERQASLSFTISQSLLRLMSIASMMPSDHLILSPPSPLAFSLSQHQGLFQWVGSSHQVAKVLELQLQHESF